MKFFLIYATGLATSLYIMDIHSDNVVFNLLAPIGIAVFAFLMLAWLAAKSASASGRSASGDSTPFFGDSGGDGCGGGGGDC